ncbi:MAG TPA: tetratricopeptide repeat protein [Candidatus Megaira endosymbiont of Nemacystus decipiens]|nr:tetratricopeptide repeat protein [Candidatus Megaera endosymbiont of Nemacystus decipiens]
MPSILENLIIVLKQKMLGPDSAQAISKEDLVSLNSLIYSDDIDIETLEKIDQELYKELIVNLVHQRTDDSKQLSSLVFRDLADLHEKLADLTPDQDSEEVKHFTLSSHHKKLKYYTDSATFLQYSLLNNENKDGTEDEIYSKLSAIEGKILSVTANSNTKTTAEKVKLDSDNYKITLSKLRSKCMTKLKLAEDKGNEQKETVQSVFEYITDKMKNFLAKLYTDTIGELEQKPPCKFAIVGLGSMALKQITPWSDLEFAIILEDYSPEAVKYFRDLSHLVNFKMINLGETIIPTSKYRMTNLGETIIPTNRDGIDMSRFGKVGVNFDLGGKTPLGRISGDKPYDLIGTKDWLLWYVKNEKNIDKNLPYILENVTHVCGDVDLVEAYQKDVTAFLHQDYEGKEEKYKNQGLKNHQVRALKILEEGAVELKYIPIKSLKTNICKGDLERLMPSFESDKEGSLLDVKQEIYRLPDRMIYNLGAFFGVYAGSAWNTIRELEKTDIISPEGATNLRKATDFATSLRLKSYDQSASQTGSVRTYIPVLEHLPQEERDRIIKTTLHVENKEEVYRFFYTMTNLISEIMDISRCKSSQVLLESLAKTDFVTTNDYYKGVLYAKFLEYDKAIECLEKFKEVFFLKDQGGFSEIYARLLIDLSDLYLKLGKLNESSSALYEINILGTLKDCDLPATYFGYVGYKLAQIYSMKSDYDLAMDACKNSIKIMKNVPDSNVNLASIYNVQGEIWDKQSQYQKAIEAFSKAANICKDPFYKSNIGIMCARIGLYQEAKDLCKEAIDAALIEYSDVVNHPNIAGFYNNLGFVYNETQEYDKALKYYTHALKIWQVNAPNSPEVIISYKNLMGVCSLQKNYPAAEKYFEKALTSCKNIYGDVPHPIIADLYNALGYMHYTRGMYDEAIDSYNLSLEMNKQLYDSKNSLAIADNCNNLAIVYNEQELYNKAIQFFKKALNIKKNIYKDDNIAIADAYKNIAGASYFAGLYQDSIKYLKCELAVIKQIYSDSDIDDIVASERIDKLENFYNLVLSKSMNVQDENNEVSLALLSDIYKVTNDGELPEAVDDEVFASILNTNLNQWYEDERIEELLERQMPEDKATVLAITQFENKELLEDNLNSALECIKKEGLPVLMPIHVHGNHWVGAVIRKQADGKLQVIYNDPKGHSIQDEENIITFIGIIQKHEKEANIIDLQLKQQYNDDDCGPFTVDNLVRLAMAHDIDNVSRGQLIERDVLPRNNTGAMIRLEHEELLLGGNKNNAEIFNDDDDIDISLVNTNSDDLDSTGFMGDTST